MPNGGKGIGRVSGSRCYDMLCHTCRQAASGPSEPAISAAVSLCPHRHTQCAFRDEYIECSPCSSPSLNAAFLPRNPYRIHRTDAVGPVLNLPWNGVNVLDYQPNYYRN